MGIISRMSHRPSPGLLPWSCLCTVALLVAACGSDAGGAGVDGGGDSGSASDGPALGVSVGPEGAEIALPNGGALIIPAGALADTVDIVVDAAPPAGSAVGFAVVGPFYDFGPPGTVFEVPATLRLPYQLPGEWAALSDQLVIVWKSTDGEWDALPTTVSAADGELVAVLTDLTGGGPALPGQLCASDAGCFATDCVVSACVQGICISDTPLGTPCAGGAACQGEGTCDGAGTCNFATKCPGGCCIDGECFPGGDSWACGTSGGVCDACPTGEPCSGGQCSPCWSFCDGCCIDGAACVPAAEVSAELCGASANGCVACGVGQTCEAGLCTSAQVCDADADCDPPGTCRAAVCEGGICTYPFDVTADCDDGDPCTSDDFCSAFDAVCKGALDPACAVALGGCGPCGDESRQWAGDPIGHVSVMLELADQSCGLTPGYHPGGALVLEEGGETTTVSGDWTVVAHSAGELVAADGWTGWLMLPLDEEVEATLEGADGVQVSVRFTLTEDGVEMAEVCWSGE